jgi:hypothetical protein
MSNLDTIQAFLQQHGFSGPQIAGIEGNLVVESGLDPTRQNPSEGAIGIAQWEGGRRTALQQYAAATGGSETDLTTQLNYLWSEMTGPESAALVAVKQAKTPADAAAAFDQNFERSDGSARQDRINWANKIYSGNLGLGDIVGDPLGTLGPAAAAAVDKLNPFGNWQSTAYKLVAGLAAAALVVVGMTRTVSEK